MTELEFLELRLRTILPAEYQDRYDEVKPVSMGSAGLRFASDGRVAWDEMWASFCDLAMAGGPPHKGVLLEPASPGEIAAQRYAYEQVVAEICRGIALVTALPVEASPDAGWVRVRCTSHAMAGWLLRAVAMENVSARCCEGRTIDLPAGPGYRVEKEIKNVITVIAKTCHYWTGHIPPAQQREIAALFDAMALEQTLVQPSAASEARRGSMGETICGATGLPMASQEYAGWLGLECSSVAMAIWMMRALVVSQVLARREGTVLFVALGEDAVKAVVRVHGFWLGRERRR